MNATPGTDFANAIKARDGRNILVNGIILDSYIIKDYLDDLKNADPHAYDKQDKNTKSWHDITNAIVKKKNRLHTLNDDTLSKISAGLYCQFGKLDFNKLTILAERVYKWQQEHKNNSSHPQIESPN